MSKKQQLQELNKIKQNCSAVTVEFALAFALLPAPASLVDANGALSTGRPQASIDQGADS